MARKPLMINIVQIETAELGVNSFATTFATNWPCHARDAARGSAPPIPYAARRGLGDARSGRESRLTDQTGKLSLAWPLTACARDAFLLRRADAFSLRR